MLQVIVGSYPLDFDSYLNYCDNNMDDMPLYLFDKHFARKAPQLGSEYGVPGYFAQDLFAVLGDSRPDYRSGRIGWCILAECVSVVVMSPFLCTLLLLCAWQQGVSGAAVLM